MKKAKEIAMEFLFWARKLKKTSLKFEFSRSPTATSTQAPACLLLFISLPTSPPNRLYLLPLHPYPSCILLVPLYLLPLHPDPFCTPIHSCIHILLQLYPQQHTSTCPRVQDWSDLCLYLVEYLTLTSQEEAHSLLQKV